MIYGICYSTDSRNRTMELIRYSSRTAAIAWREKQGPKGVGKANHVMEHGSLVDGSV